MTHPEELLADYVEGTLAEGERALVDAHLSTCAACREEVRLAKTAVSALASLEERSVPLGVTGPVLAEAGRQLERDRAVVWERLRWGAGIAAAAALVLVVALNVSGGDDGELRVADDGAAPAEGTPATVQDLDLIEKQDRRYSERDVRALAQSAAVLSRDDEGQEEFAQPTGAGGNVGGAVAATAAEAATEFVDAEQGLRCLTGAEVPIDDPRDRLVRLFEARFGRTPAYFAVFLESPAGHRPADTVVVWVVARRDCRILTFATQGV
jgi:hypothetical protein